MKPPNLPFVVVDTNCIVSVLANEREDNRAERSAHVIQNHGKKLTVVLPSIVYLEILGIAQSKFGDGSAGNRERMQEKFGKTLSFLEGQDFVVGQLDSPVVMKALEFVRAFGLKGADAAVVAYAAVHRIPLLYTFDHQILKIGDSIAGLQICEPPLQEDLQLELGV